MTSSNDFPQDPQGVLGKEKKRKTSQISIHDAQGVEKNLKKKKSPRLSKEQNNENLDHEKLSGTSEKSPKAKKIKKSPLASLSVEGQLQEVQEKPQEPSKKIKKNSKKNTKEENHSEGGIFHGDICLDTLAEIFLSDSQNHSDLESLGSKNSSTQNDFEHFETMVLQEILPWKGKEISLESGLLAKKAQGSFLVSYGNLRILCTLCYKEKPEDYKGYTPLSINYQERAYGVGKIPSGFNRREGKTGDHEVLLGRLLDRTIRPLFPEGFCHDTQIIATLLSDDNQHHGELPLLCSLGILACILQSGIPLKNLALTCGFKKEDFPLLLKSYMYHRERNHDQDKKDISLEKETMESLEKLSIESSSWATKNSWPSLSLSREKVLGKTLGIPQEDIRDHEDNSNKDSSQEYSENSKILEKYPVFGSDVSPDLKEFCSTLSLESFILGCHKEGVSMMEVQGQEISEEDLFPLLAGAFYILQDFLGLVEVLGQKILLHGEKKTLLQGLRTIHHHQKYTQNLLEALPEDFPWPKAPDEDSTEIFHEKQEYLRVYLGEILREPLGYLQALSKEKDHWDFFDALFHYGLHGAKTYQKLLLEKKSKDLSSQEKNLQDFLSVHPWSREDIHCAVKHLWSCGFQELAFRSQKRYDGRDFHDVRSIFCSAGILPQCYGSALFGRGDTQSLVSVTLGGKEEGVLPEDIRGAQRESVMFHYNFPPFSVGEVGKINMVSRREIGHGRLALKGILPIVPKDFPFSIRLVSEILGSSGSSSMASICGAILALYNAGVPLKNPVGGISLGLLRHNNETLPLVDISALEDHIGAMDLKIARSPVGITAIQMDSKDEGLTLEELYSSLLIGKKAILNILDTMGLQCPLVPSAKPSKTQPLFHEEIITLEEAQHIGKKDHKFLRDFFRGAKAKVDVSPKGVVSFLCPNAKGLQEAKKLLDSLKDDLQEKDVTKGPKEEKFFEKKKNSQGKKEGCSEDSSGVDEKSKNSIAFQEILSSEAPPKEKSSEGSKKTLKNTKKPQEKKKKIKKTPKEGEPIGGHIYEGTVVEILPKEAKIAFGFAENGFLPLGEIADYPIEDITKVLDVGETIRCRFLDYVPKRGYRLSLKQV